MKYVQKCSRTHNLKQMQMYMVLASISAVSVFDVSKYVLSKLQGFFLGCAGWLKGQETASTKNTYRHNILSLLSRFCPSMLKIHPIYSYWQRAVLLGAARNRCARNQRSYMVSYFISTDLETGRRKMKQIFFWQLFAHTVAKFSTNRRNEDMIHHRHYNTQILFFDEI